jgi:phasin family protein
MKMPSSERNVRDQNVASIETVRDGARQMADVTRQAGEATQETIRIAVDAASRVFQSSADQVARSFGLSGEHGEDLAQQATKNLEAVTACSAILVRGFQDISREWLGLVQHGLQKNIEGVQALTSCRNVQDVVAAQTELVRENIQQMVNNSRQIAESSVRVANEAAQTLRGQKSGSHRLHRAA